MHEYTNIDYTLHTHYSFTTYLPISFGIATKCRIRRHDMIQIQSLAHRANRTLPSLSFPLTRFNYIRYFGYCDTNTFFILLFAQRWKFGSSVSSWNGAALFGFRYIRAPTLYRVMQSRNLLKSIKLKQAGILSQRIASTYSSCTAHTVYSSMFNYGKLNSFFSYTTHTYYNKPFNEWIMQANIHLCAVPHILNPKERTLEYGTSE